MNPGCYFRASGWYMYHVSSAVVRQSFFLRSKNKIIISPDWKHVYDCLTINIKRPIIFTTSERGSGEKE